MNLKLSKMNGGGGPKAFGAENVQSSTLNTQHSPTGALARRKLGCWLLSAGCWLLLSCAGFQTFAQTTNRASTRDFSSFQLINDRNIFDPNRRPRVQQTRNPTPRAPQIVDRFSLVGTMSYSSQHLAFFEGTSSEYRKSVAAGNKIAGYTVSEIRHDAVKLTLGTNELELKVGMQMRRSEDGSWASGEGASTGSSNAYASGDRQRGNDRGERGERRFGRGNNSDSNNDSETSRASSFPEPPPGMAPPEMAGLDPNDPVARLMLRRMMEENGGQPIQTQPPAGEATTVTSGNSTENQETAPTNPPATDENLQNVPPNSNENRN
ncbi:MAG: hypothetical protein H7Y43_16420 [Akkermansiaceae bacterium]|nr:hypothetical protein [Verrucomicrobiales bacterium]